MRWASRLVGVQGNLHGITYNYNLWSNHMLPLSTEQTAAADKGSQRPNDKMGNMSQG